MQSEPSEGSELVHPELANKLRTKVEFTKAEWKSLKIDSVCVDQYVRSDGYFYKPAPPEAHGGRQQQQQQLEPSAYANTIHAANSAIIKLSKKTGACTVYRGLVGGQMPKGFHEKDESAVDNVRGGVDVAFMSMSTKREKAVQFAMRASRQGSQHARVLFEVQMGMVDRGADVSFLSQFPEESEILFAPLTGLEVVGEPREETFAEEDGGSSTPSKIMIYKLRLVCNLQDETLDKVVGKMQHSHLALLDLMMSDLKSCHAPATALLPLEDAKNFANSRESSWFNVADNFRTATNKALEAREQVLSRLADPLTWDSSGEDERAQEIFGGGVIGENADNQHRGWVHLRSNHTEISVLRSMGASADTAQRMRGLARVCANEGKHELASNLLCLARKREVLVATSNETSNATSAATTSASTGSHGENAEEASRQTSDAGEAAGADVAPLIRSQIRTRPLATSPTAAGAAAEGALDLNPWRVDAASSLLMEGLVSPWPATLQVLAQQGGSDICQQIGQLATELHPAKQRFVIAWSARDHTYG